MPLYENFTAGNVSVFIAIMNGILYIITLCNHLWGCVQEYLRVQFIPLMSSKSLYVVHKGFAIIILGFTARTFSVTENNCNSFSFLFLDFFFFPSSDNVA